MKKITLAILLSGLWLNANEFLRNEIVFKNLWINKFDNLNLTFPSQALNGIMWIIWGFIFCASLTLLLEKFSCIKSSIITWLLGFVLMWIVCWNLNTLPTKILFFAVPWSLAEVYIAALISKKLQAP